MLKNVKNRPFWRKNRPEEGLNRVTQNYFWLTQQDVTRNSHFGVKKGKPSFIGGKNIEKTSKIGQLATFEVKFWKNKGVNENSGSIRLQRKVGPSFNWKEKKF